MHADNEVPVTRRAGPRSARQADARRIYDDYMTSPEWAARRRRWYGDERRANEGLVHCGVCRRVCGRDSQLHHVTYDRLGSELHEDLVALCKRCHHTVERYFAELGWRTLGARATMMRALMRRLQGKRIGA